MKCLFIYLKCFAAIRHLSFWMIYSKQRRYEGKKAMVVFIIFIFWAPFNGLKPGDLYQTLKNTGIMKICGLKVAETQQKEA